MTNFPSSIARITHAQEHINALEAEISPIIDPINVNPNLITHNINLEAREQTWHFIGEVPDIPIRISLILGDCLHSLRAALDYLVWQLVLINGKIPGDKNVFPIFLPNKSTEYESSKKTKLKGVSQAAIAIIDGLQPCNGGNPSLSMLYGLSNTDKHRYLNIAVAKTTAAYITGKNKSISQIGALLGERNFSPLKKNAILFRFRNVEMEMDVKFTFEIVFSDPELEFTKYLPVIQVIWSIRDCVQDIVSHFEHLPESSLRDLKV